MTAEVLAATTHTMDEVEIAPGGLTDSCLVCITVQLDRLHVMHKTEFATAHRATPADRPPPRPQFLHLPAKRVRDINTSTSREAPYTTPPLPPTPSSRQALKCARPAIKPNSTPPPRNDRSAPLSNVHINDHPPRADTHNTHTPHACLDQLIASH